jgi:hypothetical protein
MLSGAVVRFTTKPIDHDANSLPDARSQLTLCGNFLIYLFLLAPSPEQVHSAFELLGSFHESLQRLREWADDDASLALLRPVALRIDSFFLHAARIMRNGMAGTQAIAS